MQLLPNQSILFWSGVDGFRNPMKNKVKTRPCLKRFQTNLHINKAAKTRGDKKLYLITHFTKENLTLNYLLLTLNVMYSY